MNMPIILDMIPTEALEEIRDALDIFLQIMTSATPRYFVDGVEVTALQYMISQATTQRQHRAAVNINGLAADAKLIPFLSGYKDVCHTVLKMKEERQNSGVNTMHGPGCDCQPTAKKAETAPEPQPEAAPATDFPRVIETENAVVVQVSAQDLDKIMEILAAQKVKKPEYSKKIEAEIPESIKNAVQAMDACTWAGEETDPVPLMRSPASRDLPGKK